MQAFDIGIAQNNDIALVFLDTPVTEIPTPISQRTASGIYSMLEMKLMWWAGVSKSPPHNSKRPQQVVLPLSNKAHPLFLLGVYEFQVGALTEEVRKCHGDSGGPSFLEMDGALRVVGVTSHAYDDSDCFETGGVDTRVDPFLDWIDGEMRIRCEDGTRAWCEVPGIVDPDSIDNGSNENDGSEDNENAQAAAAPPTLPSGLCCFSAPWHWGIADAILLPNLPVC